MDRITILGPCGAGKSTLATELAERLGLPLIHLDKEYWRPGWTEADPAEWDGHVDELIARPRWIMDGNYGGSLVRRLERTQLVVNLDYQRHVFFPRMVWRLVSNYGRTRPDMAEGCREQFDWFFMKYTWTYRTAVMPRREARLTASGVPVIDLKSPREMKAWLAAGAPLGGAPPRGATC